jgi:selenocysteine lyase/cysteine desulfurase
MPLMTQDTSLAGLDLDLVRSRFPALASDWTFFDNGGGSQILGTVLDRMRDFLVTSNVQLGASYDVSLIASERLSAAHAAVATLVNAASPDEVIMGPSTTALLRTLSQSVGGSLGPGDEIIVTTGDHEANIGPWLELERAGATIRFWEVDSDSGELVVEDLTPLLGPRTKLVAMTHASNILGTINPVRQIADLVHEHGAWLCVDGVGFAPHRAVDVRALDADFYAFSFYKTFGPHHAVLYGKLDLLRELPGHGFYFISEEDVPYKFQPGNVNYELSYSLLGLLEYLTEIGDGSVTKAFGRIALH